MEQLAALAQGFAQLFSPLVLVACILGLLAGLLLGFLPGVSPLGAVALGNALLMPVIVAFGPFSPAVFLVAVAYGTIYGRTLATINADGPPPADAPASPPTHVVGLIVAIIAAAAVGALALAGQSEIVMFLGPAEFVAIIVFLLLAGAAFALGSTASALAMIALGMLLGLVGEDLATGDPRLTFGLPQLADGFGTLNVALGLFVIAHVIHGLAGGPAAGSATTALAIPNTWLKLVLGALAGLMPTNGTAIASTVQERHAQPSADPFDPGNRSGDPIGTALAGDIRFSVALIPVLIGLYACDALTTVVQKIVQAQQGLNIKVAGRTGTLWLICATLVLLHIVPLIMIATPKLVRWRPIRLDVRIVGPVLVAACCLATYLPSRSLTDVGLMFGFGVIGYLMLARGIDRSLLFLAFMLGPMVDENIRRSMMIARGDWSVFLTRPIAGTLILAGVVALVAIRFWRHRQRKAAV